MLGFERFNRFASIPESETMTCYKRLYFLAQTEFILFAILCYILGVRRLGV
jgi:hypothetical protein